MEIPQDMLYEILLRLPYDYVMRFISTNRQYLSIRDDNNFWRLKFQHDNGHPPPIGANYRQLCKEYNIVYTWGDNAFGELGRPSSDEYENDKQHPASAPPAKAIACGDGFTLLIDADDWLWGCGNNDHGQLALDGVRYTEVFRLLPFKNRVKSVVCSNSSSLILDEYSDVYLMDGGVIKKIASRIQQIAMMTEILMLSEDGNIYCYGEPEAINLDIYDNFRGHKIVKIASNQYGHVLLDSDSVLWYYGIDDEPFC